MDKNITNALIGELHSASSYMERILHAVMDITPYGNTKEIKELISITYFEVMSSIEIGMIREEFVGKGSFNYSSRELRTKLQGTAKFFENILKLDFNQEATSSIVVEFINTIYENAFKLHLLCFEKSGIEIQYPRMNVIEMEEIEQADLEKSFFKFFLPIEKLMMLGEENGIIHSLALERDKKYDDLLQKGHKAIYNKVNDEALTYFEKARSLSDTAEVLTLIGWCHSLKKDWEQAKAMCLKAIQKDPDYGPPYNDLGNYLLSEGQVNESLKWFELAKKATQYQNREYPYINAGRAYIAKKEYDKALEEFSKALTIAPYHDELHETVLNLRKGLEKGNDIFDNLGEELNDQGDNIPTP
ncbi:MAG: tetratricopeptide repeat protein [Bacteriovoracaceae bacterium]|nr:tetratricopeptide repeat protein [Bacteriovoracaceae bacterium]